MDAVQQANSGHPGMPIGRAETGQVFGLSRLLPRVAQQALSPCPAPRCPTVRTRPANQNAVLPRTLPRLSIEAGVSSYWRRHVGLDGAAIGIDRIGESVPAGRLFDFFGFTVTHVVDSVKSLLSFFKETVSCQSK